MLPRTTLEGLVIDRSDFSPIASPVRVTVLASTYTQKTNPWIPLHDGTVKDALSLANWELSIPSYDCTCQQDYMTYKTENPPDFSSPEALWLWGVSLHNWVNRKLEKPELTIEEARKIWRSQDALATTEDPA